MTQANAHTPRELDSRASDGIHVRLLWYPTADRVSVEVADTRTREVFELAVCDRRRARDVFHHPYAYAACRGSDKRGETTGPAPAHLASAVDRET